MKLPLRVLLLEDNPNDATLTLATLETNGIPCDALQVETRDEFVEALEKGGFDLILSDCTLPTFDGLSALKIAKELHAKRVMEGESPRRIPFVFVSGSIGEERAIETLKSGATDYVLKERLARLVPVVHRAMAETEEHNARLAAEQSRRQAESLFRSLFDTMAGGVAITDLNGRIVQANPALNAMLGYGPGELAGTDLLQRVHPEDSAIGVAADHDLCAGRRPSFEVERRFLRRDGVARWGREVVSLIRDEKGGPRFKVNLIEDVTERKEMQGRVIQSQKMEAVGRLAAGIAHDFNNLLTVINGYSESVLTQELPRRAHEQVANIRKAGEKAGALTRQILTFSRQQVLQLQVVDLNSLLQEIDGLLRRMIGDGVEFQMVLAPNLAAVKVDPGQMEQVLMNLAVNARDAMPHGGTFRVETANVVVDEAFAATHPDMVAGPYTVLVITDTGAGMSPETKAHIFEPFFTTKPVGQGTGLGLATVFGIIRQSGGHLLVESELGRGTSMRVYLPSLVGEQPASGN